MREKGVLWGILLWTDLQAVSTPSTHIPWVRTQSWAAFHCREASETVWLLIRWKEKIWETCLSLSISHFSSVLPVWGPSLGLSTFLTRELSFFSQHIFFRVFLLACLILYLKCLLSSKRKTWFAGDCPWLSSDYILVQKPPPWQSIWFTSPKTITSH